MRLAVLSDIHGNLAALDAVLADLERAGGADRIWILGDLCAFGPRPTECLHRVRDLAAGEAIRGNTDRYVITGQRRAVDAPQDEAEWRRRREQFRARDASFNWTASALSFADCTYLACLPDELQAEIAGYGRALGYHGTPGDDEGLILPTTADRDVIAQMGAREGILGFGGHTHLAMDRDLGRWRVVNVGSVGLPLDETRPCYALATSRGGAVDIELRRVEYDPEAVVSDLRQQGHPAWEWVTARLRGTVAW
jgi:predicted phosphodiesterase